MTKTYGKLSHRSTGGIAEPQIRRNNQKEGGKIERNADDIISQWTEQGGEGHVVGVLKGRLGVSLEPTKGKLKE